MVFGGIATVVGAAGVVWADYADDSVCYMSASKNVGGNWIGPPTQANCNTTDCPPNMGGPGACQVRSGGASSHHPGYQTSWCKCSPGGGVWCELVFYYKDDTSPPTDFFYACPTPPCDVAAPPRECRLDGSGPYTCKCK